MKKLIVTIGVAVIGLSMSAQEVSKEEWRQMSKKERKEYKMAAQIANQKKTVALLESRAWVLEAVQIQNKYGESANIQPTLNFVGVSGENATAQLGASDGIGWNGVGGITVEGKIRTYKLKEGKPGSGVSLRIDIMGASSGSLNLSIQANPDGSATATVSDNTGGRITYRGTIVPLSESRVYKGQTTY